MRALRWLSLIALLFGILPAGIQSASASAYTATGAFYTTAGHIIDPNGNVFVPYGINIFLNYADNAISSTNGKATPLTTLFPGVNWVRLNIYALTNPTTSGATYPTSTTPIGMADGSTMTLAAIVAELSAAHIFTEIEDHTCEGGFYFAPDGSTPACPPFTGASLTPQTNMYTSLATSFSNNAYVGFGSLNEPNSSDSTYGSSAIGAISTQQLADYRAVRAGSTTGLFIAEAGLGGGNPGTVGSNSGFIVADYSSMHGLVWDLHDYYQNESAGTSGICNGPAIGTTAVSSLIGGLQTSGQNGGQGYLAAQSIQSADGVVPTFFGEMGSCGGSPSSTDGSQIVGALQPQWYSYGGSRGNWNYYNGTTTSPVTGTSTVISAPGSTFTVGGVTYGISASTSSYAGYQVLINGTPDTLTGNIAQIANVGGQVWIQVGAWGATPWNWYPDSTDWQLVYLGTPDTITTWGQIVANWIATGPTPPTCTTSANYTTATTTGTTLYNTACVSFSFNTAKKVVINGTADNTTSNAVELAYVNGNLWYENSSGTWFQYLGTPGSYSAGTSTSPLPVVSGNPTVVTTVGPVITSANYTTFSISSAGTILINGVSDSTTANVIELAYVSGNLWQKNQAGNWYEYLGSPGAYSNATTTSPLTNTEAFTINTIATQAQGVAFTVSGAIENVSTAPTMQYEVNGGAWTALPGGSTVTSTAYSYTNPSLSMSTGNTISVRDAGMTSTSTTSNMFAVTLPASANDATVTTVGPQLVDASGNTYSISSTGTILINGTSDPTTANVVELAYVNGNIWQLNQAGNWYEYLGTPGSYGAATTISPLPTAEAITVNAVGQQIAGDAFILTGTIAGLTLVPTLQYSINGGTWVNFPTVPTPNRNYYDQPGGAGSVWNTPIGSGATWTTPSDPITIAIHEQVNTSTGAITPGPFAFINSPNNYGQTYYAITSGGVISTINATANGRTQGIDSGSTLTATLHLPSGAYVPGPYPGDNQLIAADPVNYYARQYTFGGGWSSLTTVEPPGITTPQTLTTGQSEWDDATANDFGEDFETGNSGGNVGAGLINYCDVNISCNPFYPEIRHGLRFSTDQHLELSNPLTPGSQLVAASSWPQRFEDPQSSTPYTGVLPYGSTIAIPITATMPTGLDANCQGFWWTLQHYPAIQRDTASGGLHFTVDQVADTSAYLTSVRACVSQIAGYLARMTNQHQAGQSFVTNPKNGPGTRLDTSGPLPEAGVLGGPVTPTSFSVQIAGLTASANETISVRDANNTGVSNTSNTFSVVAPPTVGPSPFPPVNALAGCSYKGQVVSFLGNGLVCGTTQKIVTTVESLPSCTSALIGQMYIVTDASSPVALGGLMSGGAVVTGALCTGSTWIAE